jgi:hypothetical protein
MADQPVKESVELNQQTAENELINLLNSSQEGKATGNENETQEAKVDQSTKVKSEEQELTPDDLELVSEDTTTETDEKLYEVKVNGETIKVSLEELQNGYAKDSDYRKKTSKLSEERKTLEGERQKILDEMNVANQKKSEYVKRLEEVVGTLKPPKFSDSELERLFEEDPTEYVKAQAMVTRERERQMKLKSELEKEKQDQAMDYQKKMQVVLKNEQKKLIEKLPQLADPNKAENIRNDIKKFLTSQGYTSQELENLTDHRTVLVAYNAMQLDKLKKAKLDGKKVKRVPRVTTSGSQPISSESSSAIQKAMASQQDTPNKGNDRKTKDAFLAWTEAQQL